MSAPLVSVLIPCFNAKKYIAETLYSVLEQTYTPLEIIVVDDGSTDGSAEEVERFSGVKLVRQANAGAPTARNIAFSHSHGDFIQYLDADDLLAPDKIAFQMARLADNPDCIASAEWGRFYQNKCDTAFSPDGTWADLDGLDWLALSRQDGGGMMYPALWLVPRSICTKAGPWTSQVRTGAPPSEDAEYFTRVILAARKVLFCAGARTYYRSGIGGESSSRDFQSHMMLLEMCQRHVLAAEDSTRMRLGFAKSWQVLAHKCYPYDGPVSQEALRKAHALHPVRISPGGGWRFHLVSSLVGWKLARRLQVWSGRP